MIKAGYSTSESTPGNKETSADMGEKKNYSMNVRKISNGWIVRECWETGEGEKRKYEEIERYTEKSPID